MDPQNYLLSFLKELAARPINEDTGKWLNEYLNGDQSIIHSLIFNISDHFEEQHYAIQAFEGLRKIYEINPETFIGQIKENKKVPQVMVNFMAYRDPQLWNKDVLLILLHSFDGNRFHHQIVQLGLEFQKNFVTHILDRLTCTDDEEQFTVFVLLLVEFWDNEQIAQFMLQHDNIRFFQEFLLEYLNKTENDVSKPLFFIETILKHDKDFFYVNDFKVLQQVSIRQVQNGTQATRQFYLRNLNVLVYYGNSDQLLKDEILETMEMVQNSYDDHYSLRKSQQVIENLKRK